MPILAATVKQSSIWFPGIMHCVLGILNTQWNSNFNCPSKQGAKYASIMKFQS